MNAEFFVCPHCGAELAEDAEFCRECGASDDAGWGDPAEDDVVGDDFDYAEFVQREFPEGTSRLFSAPIWVVLVVLLVCLAMLLLTVW